MYNYIIVNNSCLFKAELAITNEEQETGLMYRNILPEAMAFL